MRKSEIVDRVAGAVGLSKSKTAEVFDEVIEEIVRAVVEGEAVTIAGFGTFSARVRSARMGRNPRTGEAVRIDASRAPGFKAGKVFRRAVADGAAGAG